jgi:hypothetical protein
LDKQIWKNSKENSGGYGVIRTTRHERIVVRNLGEDAERCKESMGYRSLNELHETENGECGR